ncbi:hypothetical protein HYS03_00510 [Candidatus Woesebacteria bacterium]|nr:hypothetical protein [Candidatus Woesebacteria bacterium]QQG47628.1 MAG: hypothetical protein HY044_00900 [Candidatus Woesebacteria bacterium]
MKLKATSQRLTNPFDGKFYIKELDNFCVFILGPTDFEESVIEKVKSKKDYSDLFAYISGVFEEEKTNRGMESLGILCFRGNVLYFYLFGKAKLSLNRGGKLWIFNESGSGIIKESDTLTLGNPGFDFINFSINRIPTLDLRPFVLRLPKFLPKGRTGASFVERTNPRKRKIVKYLSIFIGALFLISIFLGFRKIEDDKRKAIYKPKIEQAARDFSDAKALASVDPEKARELAFKAKGSVLGLQTEGIKDPELEKLSTDISQNIGSISHVFEGEPSLYLDLTLISDGFETSDVSQSEGHMAVLNSKQHKIVTIDLQSKKTQTFAIPLVVNPIFLSSYSDHDFVMGNDGIWDIAENSSKILDESYSTSDFFTAYTGNVYILKKNDGVIYRYQGVGGGKFSVRDNWFGVGVKPDLTNARRFVIDGNIWILSDNGDLEEFSGGVQSSFSLGKVDGDFNPIDIYTDIDSSSLYLLDSKSPRVLVFDKKGQFIAEYHFGGKSFKRIIADEANRKIYLFDNQKIYYLDAKHLN